ncbi:MAG TPA: flagellar motor protein MotB, partial [Sphingomicrobium sp.]|nr:flagellar motor protein MotB [Sphingomicrobium sp.]
MRYIIVAALAATSLSTPALAADDNWYAGIEAGLLWPQEETLSTDFEGSDVDIIDREYKTGFDGD